jgi:multidrug resistance efflux pump
MQKGLSRVQIFMIVLFVIALTYFGYRVVTNRDDGKLRASGTIEAVEVNVSPETSGKIEEVFVDEGQTVMTGEPLLRLDDSLLSAQRQVAQTGVDSAHDALLTAQSAYKLVQAQYEATFTSARTQQGSQRLTDWANRAPSEFDQPLWFFSHDEQITAAQAEVDSALQALQQSQVDLDHTIHDLNNADFVAAETRLSNTRFGYQVANTVNDHAQLTGGEVSPEDVRVKLPPNAPSYRIKIAIANRLSGDSEIVNAAQDAFDVAKTELDEAQQAYNALLNTDAADRVLKARATLSVAQERYEVALDTLNSLQTGEYSPQVEIAARALDQAKATLDQAQSTVNSAQANLDLIEAQMSKLTISAPMDGVILARNVEPGGFVQPGGAALTMANLNELTITVYVPEDRYGEIHLGQEVSVSVDSFPGQTFTATVNYISDQAEFTPRNVQTVQGRSATVYAVKLKVSDPAGKLKLGMPADVVFTQ